MKMNVKDNASSKKITLYTVLIIAAIAVLVVWIGLVITYAVLRGNEYLADWEAIREYDVYEGDYSITKINDGDTFCFVPDKIEAGLIFYQDEFVENCSYIPLMRNLANSGVLCIVPTMPFNLSIFDKNAAEELKSEYPEVNTWYLGGHGLGGEAAASCFSKNYDVFAGLILLGSYSRHNLCEASLPVLSIYGTEDGVIDMEKYEKYKSNLPETTLVEYVIEGGNHSGFAVYGLHKGDKEAKISGSQQMEIAGEQIISFMLQGDSV